MYYIIPFAFYIIFEKVLLGKPDQTNKRLDTANDNNNNVVSKAEFFVGKVMG